MPGAVPAGAGERAPTAAATPAGTVPLGECAELCDPERLRALELLGLTAGPDEPMDDFARWAREALGVPVALVSLVRPDAQVFPGMTGLPEPWASRRSTPLSHSFCRHVVLTAEPLVVDDAREHPLVRDNPAVADLGVVAYAGMPLVDDAGNVLGSLCAIDTLPRRWTAGEVDTLRRIARACATELRLRLAGHDAGREQARRDQVEHDQRQAIGRGRTLLLASQAFVDAVGVDDVLTRVQDLVAARLAPDYVGAVVVDDDGRTRRLDDDPVRLSPTHSRELDPFLPSASSIRDAAIVHYPDRASFAAHHPQQASEILRHLGLHSILAVPLPGPDGPIGSIVLGWRVPNVIDTDDLLTVATIGGYASQALARARLVDHRISVAHEMQNAMLTTLPPVDGLTMAARYVPADSREHVGGDWYDAARLTGPAAAGRGAGGGRSTGDQVVVLSVGDIVGHTIDAATVMGQARSMLRQAAWDHPAAAPSVVLTAFEHAAAGLGLRAAGSAVLARLQETAGRWTMTWTNAGHPPPILLTPDGRAELLTEHDVMFGFALSTVRPRTDVRRDIAPGSTLVLYTDGLVEKRTSDIDAGTAALLGLLRRLHDRPVREIVDAAVTELAADAADDVVAFAVRFGHL